MTGGVGVWCSCMGGGAGVGVVLCCGVALNHHCWVTVYGPDGKPCYCHLCYVYLLYLKVMLILVLASFSDLVILMCMALMFNILV